jgi:hypothetical protein
LRRNIHSNPGPGKALPTFITKHYVKELDGAIDIWDTGPLGYDIQACRAGTRAWRKYWIYNGGRPAAGAIVIDCTATDARATIWACFKHGCRQLLLLERRALATQSTEGGERESRTFGPIQLLLTIAVNRTSQLKIRVYQW